MISFEFHLKKWHNKTPKPLWFRGFSNRYLFRFAILVAGGGLEPPTSGLSLRAALRCPKKCSRVCLLHFFDRCGKSGIASSATGSAKPLFPTSCARRSHNPTPRNLSRITYEKKQPPYGDCFSWHFRPIWIRPKWHLCFCPKSSIIFKRKCANR